MRGLRSSDADTIVVQMTPLLVRLNKRAEYLKAALISRSPADSADAGQLEDQPPGLPYPPLAGQAAGVARVRAKSGSPLLAWIG